MIKIVVASLVFGLAACGGLGEIPLPPVCDDFQQVTYFEQDGPVWLGPMTRTVCIVKTQHLPSPVRRG